MAEQVTGTRVSFHIPRDLALWEVASTCHILMHYAKTRGVEISVYGLPVQSEGYQLCECAGFKMCTESPSVPDEVDVDYAPFRYGDAYRKLEETVTGYPNVLADLSIPDCHDLPLIEAPYYPLSTEMQDVGIVLAPAAIRRELDIGLPVWRSIARHLRTYGYPVYLIGPRGYRMDEAAFTEYEVKSECSVGEKLGLISQAKLVIGTANEWTWAAAGYKRDVIIPYPDHLPPRRWYPFAADNIGRIGCEMDKLQPPLVLAGVRQLIKLL